MGRLAERRPELAAEVRRRDVGDTGEGGDVERVRERTVHGVAAAEHAAIAVLDGERHGPSVRPAAMTGPAA